MPLGWAKKYEFTESDLRVACDMLDTWIDSVALVLVKTFYLCNQLLAEEMIHVKHMYTRRIFFIVIVKKSFNGMFLISNNPRS